MTAPDTTQVRGLPQDGSPSGGGALDVVHALTGAIPQVVSVTAVVVTRGRSAFLPATLAALRGQERAPDDVVVVDVDAPRSTGSTLGLRLDDARFVPASGARTFGEAVDVALAAGAVRPDGWLWLLHDDSAPAPGALSALLRSVEHTRAVAVAGCKQRRWPVGEDGTPLDPQAGRGLLVEVGSTVSPLGRRMTGIDDTEIDQGQHDAKEDVLAVGLAGALVRTSVWTELGGTDPEYGAFGDGLDLCRRARRAGHRVVVVPDAVVHHAQASLLGLRDEPGAQPDEGASYGPRRRSQLHHRLVHVPLGLLVPAMIGMVLWAPVAAMYRLALKNPGQARHEITAPLWNVLRIVPLVRARQQAARTSTLPRRVLHPLLATWRQVYSERRDVRLARAEANRTRWAPSELERTELRRLALRRRAGLTFALLAAAALVLAVFGPWFGVLAQGGRIVGGALLPAPGTLGDVWDAATSGWVADGLGTRAAADPLLLPLTALTALVGGSLQTAVHVLVVGAVPLAALGAWFAAGALTRSPWARVAAALVWAASPALLGTLQTGRLGALVAHLVLPWAALALVRSVGAQARDELGPIEPRDEDVEEPRRGPRPSRRARARRGSLGAAGAAGLLLTVAVCAAPVLLPVTVAAVVVGVLAAPRDRRNLVVALLPPLVVAAPFWVHVARTWDQGGWRLLLADPGAVTGTGPAPAGWQLLLGHPAVPGAWFGLDGARGPQALALLGAVGPWLLGAFVVALALVALVPRRVTAGTRTAWALAGLGVLVGLLAEELGAWPGVGASLVLLGLGGAALMGLPAAGDVLAPTARRSGRRTALAVAGVVAFLALPAAGATSWALEAGRGDAVGDLRASAAGVVPAVGRQMQDSERAARVLQVARDDDGVVGYALLHADGSALTDASVAVRGRDAGTVEAPERSGRARLDALAADLVVGQAPRLAERLADVGVGAVEVPPGADPDLVTTLDMVPGLSRVTEGDGPLLWRVDVGDEPPPSWARLTDGPPDGGDRPTTLAVVASDGRRVNGDVTVAQSPDQQRTLVLASVASKGWRATLDGQRLPVVEAGGLQAFAVPPEGGWVRVEFVDPARPLWLAGAGFVLLVYVLLALPVGRRRGR
ncbi:glycosyltransferase family 2 protein [Xylanimonas oleitrophica]|uniref:Glycosyltransferase family 2 protein n=1 Tax=Xylanimonas oleitrophica TaxID=2607479 RepID=A0A2W5X217_9MICO|nr:glycosyltransferase [Xylanimonas oleitrophica]PZR54365.1 glycosyltransferase family 2 protein [Xylanimonas oleitrophica]